MNRSSHGQSTPARHERIWTVYMMRKTVRLMHGFGQRTIIIYDRWTKVGGWTERPSTSWKVSDERPWVFVINGRRTNKDSSPPEQIRAMSHYKYSVHIFFGIKLRTEVDGLTDGRKSVRGGLVKSEVSYGAVKVSLDV